MAATSIMLKDDPLHLADMQRSSRRSSGLRATRANDRHQSGRAGTRIRELPITLDKLLSSAD
jgi:hypothetical protein